MKGRLFAARDLTSSMEGKHRGEDHDSGAVGRRSRFFDAWAGRMWKGKGKEKVSVWHSRKRW